MYVLLTLPSIMFSCLPCGPVSVLTAYSFPVSNSFQAGLNSVEDLVVFVYTDFRAAITDNGTPVFLTNKTVNNTSFNPNPGFLIK